MADAEAMDIGIALPTMCRGYDRAATIDWCRLAEAGPVSSISCGERMAFHNPEMWTTLAAAAAITERVRIIANLSVLPAHPVPLVAKQAATLDVLSGGRFTLGVGVGGRADDYRSLGTGFGRRHERLERAVAELRTLWAGEPPPGATDPIGPPCVQRVARRYSPGRSDRNHWRAPRAGPTGWSRSVSAGCPVRSRGPPTPRAGPGRPRAGPSPAW